VSFTIATTVDDALTALAAGARPIAGGTDLVVGARHGKAPLPDDLVAVDRIAELAVIEPAPGGGVRIGAGVTHATLMNDATVVGSATAIADASALVGSPATRHVGTLGGNVMNGSPAMDTGAPLMVLGAEVELRSMRGTRSVPLDELWTGPGTTSAERDELCTALVLPPRQDRTGSAYVRLEYRRAMEIAVVGAAASVRLADDGTIAELRVALSAVAPTIVAVDVASCVGHRIDDNVLAAIAQAASARAAPIDDLRASSGYRRHTVGVMARRAVDAAARRAEGEPIAVPVNRSIGIGVAS
jgi:CO/xanthine dehydrogenase FAD-binding subunit